MSNCNCDECRARRLKYYNEQQNFPTLELSKKDELGNGLNETRSSNGEIAICFVERVEPPTLEEYFHRIDAYARFQQFVGVPRNLLREAVNEQRLARFVNRERERWTWKPSLASNLTDHQRRSLAKAVRMAEIQFFDGRRERITFYTQSVAKDYFIESEEIFAPVLDVSENCD